jgi:heme exporter protein CcmD|tara:strand:- start:1134 stop:1316 length:183 start_codon:yes stop_codon:yes gene_type:complete
VSFDSVESFFHMGGHALYVWMVFGASLAGLVGNLINLNRTHRAAVEAAAREPLVSEEEPS